jgi:histone deacetylase complex regulatory component SIN3
MPRLAVQYDLRKDGTLLFEKIRKRVPASTWIDILKVLRLYSEDVLQDSDLTEMIGAACASPSNDLAQLFEDFMVRCAFGRNAVL